MKNALNYVTYSICGAAVLSASFIGYIVVSGTPVQDLKGVGTLFAEDVQAELVEAGDPAERSAVPTIGRRAELPHARSEAGSRPRWPRSTLHTAPRPRAASGRGARWAASATAASARMAAARRGRPGWRCIGASRLRPDPSAEQAAALNRARGHTPRRVRLGVGGSGRVLHLWHPRERRGPALHRARAGAGWRHLLRRGRIPVLRKTNTRMMERQLIHSPTISAQHLTPLNKNLQML